MKIGITEYGDAGLDFRWVKKLPKLDGAILISKAPHGKRTLTNLYVLCR